MDFERLVKKYGFAIILIGVIAFYGINAASFSVIGKTVNYASEVTEVISGRCQSTAWGLSIINIPNGVSSADITITSSIDSVDNIINSMWVDSTTSRTTAKITSNRFDLGTNPAQSVICSKGGNCETSGLDGSCTATYNVKFSLPIALVPTPEIIVFPMPTPTLTPTSLVMHSKYYISNGQCLSTTTPSLISSKVYNSLKECTESQSESPLFSYAVIFVGLAAGIFIILR